MTHKTEIRCFKRFLALTGKTEEGEESADNEEALPVSTAGYTSS
jgi:hypothetical protein